VWHGPSWLEAAADGSLFIRQYPQTDRVPYHNTIRDLFDIDIPPFQDFPSDDVGHGFDNIGEVLSLSPLLMERYLGAENHLVPDTNLLQFSKIPKTPNSPLTPLKIYQKY
jgi:hypothetical protein